MREPMLFSTTVPVLLGGRPSDGGRLSARLYARYGLEPHWFGRGWHPLLSVYARRHPVTVRFAEANDGILLRLLLDFEKNQRPVGGIACLIPCAPAAKAFLARTREVLEEHFVLLEAPTPTSDPLYGLVHGH